MIKMKFNVGDRWDGYIVKHVHFVHSQWNISKESDSFHIERGHAQHKNAKGKWYSSFFGIDKKLNKAAANGIMISAHYIGDGF